MPPTGANPEDAGSKSAFDPGKGARWPLNSLVIRPCQPTIPELKAILSDSSEIDRTEISWENVDFRRAVEATGRKKLIMTALWTEVCLAFPSRCDARGI
jgi:hypothetical protein